MNCYCGHDMDWAHYKRTPGNGQKFDNVCVDCILFHGLHTAIDPWHRASKEKT